MPPQPIDMVKLGARYRLRYDPMSDDPAISVAIANCITQWSRVELHIGYLFASLLKINEKQGASLFASFESASAKRHAIRTLALSTMTEEELLLFDKLLSQIKSHQKIRDKVAHWLIGISEDIKNAFVLVDQKMVWVNFGHIIQDNREFIENHGAKASIGNDGLPNKFTNELARENVYVYTISSLDADVRFFSDLKNIIVKFILYASIPINSDARRQLFIELAQDSRLAAK